MKKTPSDVKIKGPSRTVAMVPPMPILRNERDIEWELEDTSLAAENLSIIYRAVAQETSCLLKKRICFEEKRMVACNAPGAKPLTGDEEVIKDFGGGRCMDVQL